MDTHNVTQGSCLCGQIKFEIEGAFESFFFCHCKHCQKDTGSAHAANLFSTTARLNWLKGQTQVSSFNLPGTRHVKAFCKTCGSAMPNLQMDGKLVVVPAGSLDGNVEITPNAHIFYASRANWDNDLEQVPRINTVPG